MNLKKEKLNISSFPWDRKTLTVYYMHFNEAKAPSAQRRRNLKGEVSLWKHIKCFPSTLCRRNLKTQQSAVILYLRLRKTRAGEYHFISGEYHFVLKMFPSTLKHKAAVFKFLLFEERYRKASFLRRISVDGRPNRRNKAACWTSSGVV